MLFCTRRHDTACRTNIACCPLSCLRLSSVRQERLDGCVRCRGRDSGSLFHGLNKFDKDNQDVSYHHYNTLAVG
ncbi:hypothetical protein NDU88_007570 [Pleurodeles waltl]|uniref:Uncharacterized protein n=1 Tax=Pleurodeles waltl TaxID=8319 RepID=A0AAV7WFY7_PLEWA|nr:hypothetical protein NDU88_007570 [Pleurodeles waltl]